jgi:di/tripeptidase
MRSVSPERLNGVDALFQRAMHEGLAEANRVRRDGDSLTVDIVMIGDRPSGTTDLNAPIVQRALATISYFGHEPNPSISSTNSNIPISLGIPAITISRGGAGGNGHALSEWWVNEDGASGVKQALLILVAEAGFSELVR